MFVKKLVPAAMAVALLAGCVSTPQEASKKAETVGGTISSKYGNASGKVASSGTGPLLGAFIGGAAIDPSDAAAAETAAKRAYAAPVGDQVGWTNPTTGHYGSLVTTRDGYNNAGQYCREFQQSVTTKSRTELAYGTACKQGDGTWKIVANS
ncbi:RT0821/Lpp0805 family surface protein [Azospirillum isscasi]|uniref:RT0821/Lpp0805 family surface protein n=1 Tax=Azospirillum isscasi TaxID=3053926 RepID=A0ABU0WGP9_9PROT|nr:RT0821/Lpp0805 family surface protein [Azospirillum isscasi]MDQ2103378.1 RT0821/Lpp0805 family surface protein [Azospirillum isscasi]